MTGTVEFFLCVRDVLVKSPFVSMTFSGRAERRHHFGDAVALKSDNVACVDDRAVDAPGVFVEFDFLPRNPSST